MDRRFFVLFFLIILFSCNNPEGKSFDEKSKIDSVKNEPIVLVKPEAKKSEAFSDSAGPRGVFDMPEILTLCVHDSASLENMPKAFSKAYSTLEKEMKTLKLKSNGAPGSIYFRTDPEKVVFECVFPIEKMPEAQPKNSMVVVLESCYMYIYNYYGPYGDLYLAYDDIRKNLKKNKLVQNGPMREFYITDAIKEKDSTKWLTRIMTPVGKIKK